MENFRHELYANRLLIFLETEPQSNKYNQVCINNEQFKKVSDAIIKSIRIEKDENGIEITEIDTSKEVYILPDLKEIN